MDSIKKKMEQLSAETERALRKYEKWEAKVRASNERADGFEEHVKNLQKKIQSMESQFDVCTEDLFTQTIKMEEMEKKAGSAEQQVGELARRLLLMEENSTKSEERLAAIVTDLAKTSLGADACYQVQSQKSQDGNKSSENNDSLEVQLKDAQYTLTESETKFETMARKLNTVEAEGQRSEERAEGVQTKFMDIEDELKSVGEKQQQLEVSEELALKKEEELQRQIQDLNLKLKMADSRSENAEMDIQRLNVRIDKVEEDLVLEKAKIKDVSDDLNKCFDDMLFS